MHAEENGQKPNVATEKDLEIEEPQKQHEQKGVGEMIMQLCLLACFMTFGPMLIMTNKHLMKDVGYDFPITHTFYTSAFCASAVWIYVLLTGTKLKKAPIVTREFYLKNIMPIGFFQGATIVLGMSSYLYLTVAFAQMLKAAGPVLIVVVLRFFGMSIPTNKVLAAVGVIVLGTVLSGYGEMNFSIIGVCTMMGAQVSEAFRLVMSQKLLNNLKFDVLEGLCYITPAAAFWVLLAALFVEAPRMNWDTLDLVKENWHFFVMSGMFAIGVNTINACVIKFTSSLMLKLLSTARAASLVLFNFFFMGEMVTGVQFCGYSISLAGFLLYNVYRK
uniref:Sugar phosphate transporter domain-containing protein n=1 Tax=Lotharella globosa TaxID=91324 RepID=A0A7S4DXF7_9EUKA